MNRDLFVRAGRALYGDRWQTQLAQALGVADRTVRRWAAGEQAVPDGAAADIYTLVVERRAELEDIAGDMGHGR
jgi:hypothetical protein